MKVVRLAHVHYQHPDLNRALLFLNDFGMVEEARVDGKVYLRGYGCQPFLYIAEQSPDDKRHFIGGYWVVAEAAELEKAATKPNASSIQDCEGPGGGKVVTIQDPNGITVGFIHGQVLREQNGRLGYLEREDSGHIANSSTEKPRKGEFRRFDAGASPVHKLGHYGFVVPGDAYEKTQEWYTGLMNLKPTDSVFDPKTGKDETCFNHIDLGSEFTDHHVSPSGCPFPCHASLTCTQSFFLARGPEHSPTYIHHSSFEVNDFDTQTLGHHWLLKKGWTNCWGVGRHVLGSQIFDYW
jgi:hypothetical protein